MLPVVPEDSDILVEPAESAGEETQGLLTLIFAVVRLLYVISRLLLLLLYIYT